MKRTTITKSTNWEFFPSMVNGSLASIRLDLEAKELGTLFQHTLYLRFPYQKDDKGLPISDELEALNGLEDLVNDELLQLSDDIYMIGSMVSNGHFDLFYVSSSVHSWDAVLKQILDDKVQRPYASGIFQDDHWSFYDETLYPNKFDFSGIYNRNMCLGLEAQGIDLEKERNLIFDLHFMEEQPVSHFVKHLSKAFKIDSLVAQESGFLLKISLMMPPTFANVNAISAELIRLSDDHHATYVMWHSPIL